MDDKADEVLILTTGGTIDKAYFDALSTYQVDESQTRRILEQGRVQLRFDIRELLRKDSIELTEEDRAEIATTVREVEHRWIVITHGTDTMTQTAAAIGTPSGKTVVLVGALSPARFTDSDAAFNLGMAFAAVQLAPPGVYVTMSGRVFDAARVRKDRALGAFVAD